MRLRLTTEVDGDYRTVMSGFDIKLFEALKPKFGKMEIKEFTGSKKGDVVRLQFISPFKQEWESKIIEDGSDENHAYFIDIGTTLPFPLTCWRHKHIVKKISDSRSLIIDDMTFKGINFMFTILLYPALLIAFYPRKKVYREYFKKLK